MKIKLILIFTFILFFCLKIYAEEKKLELQGELQGLGDIKKNQYIVLDEMFGIIFNSSESTFITAKHGAIKYCREKMSNKDASVNFYPLKKHTSYFSCVTSVQSKMEEFKFSENEGLCVNYLVFDMKYLFTNNQSCQSLKNKILPIYQKIKEKIDYEDMFSNQEFIIDIFSEYYSEIITLEDSITSMPNALLVKKNIQTCKLYPFEEGTELFSECILKLIELGAFYSLEDSLN